MTVLTQEKFLEEMEKLKKLIAVNNKTILTANECAEYTGIRLGCLYNLTYTKSIPFYKPLGGRIFFKKEEIDKWLLRNKSISNQELETLTSNHLLSQKI